MSVFVPLPDQASLPLEVLDSKHWILWKAEKREEKTAKIPCDTLGFTDSMKENHTDFFTALQNANKLRSKHGNHFGIGLAFSPEMGFVGVDLDEAIVGDRQAEYLSWFQSNHSTWGEISLSGLGVHLFYRGSFEGKRNAKIENARIEIFGTKGFIAITGRVLFPGQLSEWGPVYESIKTFVEKPSFVPAPIAGQTLPLTGTAYGTEALRVQCERVKTAPNGQLHYTLCSASCSIGRLIPLYISWDDAEAALFEATVQAGGRDMDNARRTIRGQLEFGMTDPARPIDRWEYRSENGTNGVDLSEFGRQHEEPDIEEHVSNYVEDPGKFPEHLLKVPGFIGDVCEYTNRNSFIHQPILSLAGALCLMSVLTGRKIKDRTNLRTNIFVIGVAGSGFGKESARSTNKDILQLSGASHLIGPESWSSGVGLLKAVEKHPAHLSCNDEIGLLLQTTGDAKKNPHLFSINKTLLKLYTSSGRTYIGDAYADGRENNIEQPHLVLYGTTVPDALFSAFSEQSITGGLLGRVLIFEAPEQRQPKKKPEVCEPSEFLIETAKKWLHWTPGVGNLLDAIPYPFCVPTDADAEEVFDTLDRYSEDRQDKIGSPLGSIWARCTENARKLALLYACSERFGSEAVVTGQAAEWACDLVWYLVRKLCFSASSRISRNKIESDSMLIERLIRSSGESGLTGKQLMLKTLHLNRRERDETVATLVECGKIVLIEERTGKRGRPTRVYKAN